MLGDPIVWGIPLGSVHEHLIFLNSGTEMTTVQPIVAS
jgi:hypothetical protein